MPQVIVQSGQVVSQQGLARAQIVGKRQIAAIQAQRQEVLVEALLLLRLGLTAAPQQQAAAAARPEAHVNVYPVADDPENAITHKINCFHGIVF